VDNSNDDNVDKQDESSNEEAVSEENTNQQQEGQEEQEEPVDHMAAMAAAMAEAGQGDDPEPDAAALDVEINTGQDVEVTPGQSAEAIARTVAGEDVNIDALLKVPVSLSIEVGRTKMPLNDLLDTQEGAVIELERMLDEPLDILVNGALIAHGVVVLAEDRFGIQITDIISLEERARSL
jgi:flagellar motor switch protein FliN/FliY